jgi:hypothetical protein
MPLLLSCTPAGQQGDVVVATSFALSAVANSTDDGGTWQEGMDLPAAVPGSGACGCRPGALLPARPCALTWLLCVQVASR